MDEIIDKLAKQILAQGTKGWTGEGFGSAEANAKDMARILAQAGITDINQFGVTTVKVPASEQTILDESGQVAGIVPIPETTKQVYVNKATGQEIMPEYARAGGNIWSGTYSGKGSTGYGVRFDDKGNPQFYTEYGGTTSDWVPFREGFLKPAALMAGLAFGANALGLTGAGGTAAGTAGAGAAGAGAGAGAGAAGATAAELAAAGGVAGPNMLITTGKLAPFLTASEIAALTLPAAAGLISTPTVAEPTTNIEVTGAKIKPPVDGIFPTIGAGLLGAGLVSGTGAKTTSKITPSDVIKGIGTAATVASLLSDGKKESGFDIVDVPSDWRSPTRTTGTSGGVGGVGGAGNVPIDFGTMELLRGTQWERLINPAIQRSSVQTDMPGVMPGQLVQPRSIPTQFVIDQIANQTVPIAPAAPVTAAAPVTSAGPSAAPVGTTGLNLYEPGYEQRFGVTPPGSFVVGGDGQRTPEELRTEYEKNVRETALGGARYLQDLYNYQPTGRSAFGDLYTRALADPSLISRGANESIEDALLRLKANVREAEDRQAGREALRAQFEAQGGNPFVISGLQYGTDMTDPYMGASLGTALENLRRIQAQNPEYQDIQSVISALTGSPVSGVVPTAPTAPITMENVAPANVPTMPVTGGPGAVPKFPEAQLISAPDDFNMLRRMQEFRETVPAPQQISADVGLIPQFPQPVGVPLPYMPPQSYTPVGQPMGLESLIYALSNGQTDASAMV